MNLSNQVSALALGFVGLLAYRYFNKTANNFNKTAKKLRPLIVCGPSGVGKVRNTTLPAHSEASQSWQAAVVRGWTAFAVPQCAGGATRLASVLVLLCVACFCDQGCPPIR